MPAPRRLALLVVLAACGAPPVGDSTLTSDADTSTGDAGDSSTSRAESTSSAESSSSGGSSGAGPSCGDGHLDPGETCDWGPKNGTPDAPCTADCAEVPPACGDGRVDPGEACDDGAANSNAGPCLEDCTAAACGDGWVYEGSEVCDDGDADETDDCTSSCAPAACGDGFVHAGVEGCDDGNASDEDACLSSCDLNVCGDGHLLAGVESCDDGNLDAGDGCDPTCVVELVCGKTFTTSWCKQVGPTEQYTRCGSVEDDGRTCINPEIKYGTNTGGIPEAIGDANYVKMSLDLWCQQLGFAGWSGTLALGDRDCQQPHGSVGWANINDEPVPHWVEGGNGNDGYWRGPGKKLNEANNPCQIGMAILSATCM